VAIQRSVSMKENVIGILKHIDVPEFFSRSYMEQIFSQGVLGGFVESVAIRSIVEALESHEFKKQIDEGKVTLAMVKPRLKEALSVSILESNVAMLADSEILRVIEQSILEPLSVCFSISLILSPEMTDLFYAGSPMKRQQQVPPIDPERYGQHHEHRWSDYRALMVSGPVTFVILYSPDGKAISHWRKQMGDDWNVERVRINHPDSLRARFAENSHNNLLHGSDSVESVHREIALLVQFLKQTQK
jgi:nucleoside diphosphate kinase